MRYETGLRRFGSLTKILASASQPISKTKKSKMARNSDCGRFHLFDMFPFVLQNFEVVTMSFLGVNARRLLAL